MALSDKTCNEKSYTCRRYSVFLSPNREMLQIGRRGVIWHKRDGYGL